MATRAKIASDRRSDRGQRLARRKALGTRRPRRGRANPDLNGCGASVGLEAGYAQIGSAIASRTGILLRLRRQDLRTLVGCGAAGAIAAAFAAPLTGAFYAFELIVGAYSLGTAGPIIAAFLAATLTVKGLGGAPYLVTAPPPAVLTITNHLALVALGLVSAALGVGAMRAAAFVERSFQASPLPPWARPVVGGIILAAFDEDGSA